MAVDEFYAAATAADVLRSQKELARQGFSAGGRPPVGYRRELVTVGARHDGSPLTRVRWVPDPEIAPRVIQAFQMAAEGVTYDEIVAATGICENKSSLATILANPMYHGIRVFNREARVEGEHGRKRRRNPAEERVTSEVEPLVPEQLWERSRTCWSGAGRIAWPPQRYAGGYALTELLRCACGSPMAGTNNPVLPLLPLHRHAADDRAFAPNDLDAGVMDLIRRTLVTPKAVREMVQILNEDIQMRSERRAPELERGEGAVRQLEQEDANLRRALRSAPAQGCRADHARDRGGCGRAARGDDLAELDQAERPLRITPKLVRQTIDEMTGILEHAPLDTRVAWVRDLFERIDVDSRESRLSRSGRPRPTKVLTGRIQYSEWLRR